MRQQQGLQQPLFTAAMGKKAIIGAAIGLALIGVFLLTAGKGNPEWTALWWIRPLILVSLAGACGGALYHIITNLRTQNGWVKLAARVLGILVFIVGLWMGSVLGLDGTYWN